MVNKCFEDIFVSPSSAQVTIGSLVTMNVLQHLPPRDCCGNRSHDLFQTVEHARVLVQVPWKMYSSMAAAAQSFAMRRLRLNLPGAGSQLWCLSFRQETSHSRSLCETPPGNSATA